MRTIVRIFTLLALLLVSIGSNAQKVYAVCVGVADYPGEINDLKLPANDAKTIQWLYHKNRKAESVLITNKDATLANVTKAMNTLYAKAKEKDIIVLFFSGHGSKGAFRCYDEALNYDVVRQAMAKSKSRHKIVFADACYAGKMRQEGSFSTFSPDTDYSMVDVMLFLSSRSNETSIESRNMKNGFFTAFLQRGLKGGADADRNRTITAKELFDYVSKGVAKISKNRQHPVMWGHFDKSMPVMVW